MKKIAIVAHSAGGSVTTHMLAANIEDFKRRVYAIAFTDATVGSCPKAVEGYLQAVSLTFP